MNNFLKILISNRTIFLIALIFVFSLIASIFLGTKFASLGNLKAVILGQTSIAIMTIGMMALLISGVFDLSVGSLLGFSGILVGVLMQNMGLPIQVAIVITMITGAFIGIIKDF